MVLISRARSALPSTSRQLAVRQARRWTTNPSAPKESAFNVSSGSSGSESFGKGFYIFLSSIPLAAVVWKLSNDPSENEPWLTRVIDSFRENQKDLEQRNVLHLAALEQAAADRQLLFGGSPGPSSHYQLRYPENFNSASPWNVATGAQADLTTLMEYYSRENDQVDQARVSRMKDGKVHSVYDDTTGGRFPRWMPVIGNSKRSNQGGRE